MKLKFILSNTFFALFIFFFLSCKKSPQSIPSKSSNDYLNVVVAGVSYNESILNDLHVQIGGSQSSVCDSYKYIKEQFTSISPTNFDLVVGLKFYQSDSIFKKHLINGNYSLGDDQAYPEKTCNLTLLVSYFDNSSSSYAKLVSGGKNTITSIVKGNTNSTSQDYIIQGNFTCSWLLNGNSIPCSGTYQKTIEVSIP
ncbi:MAG: hypothetical protein RLZZ318_253 [Bacteroidota bacterium]|jgi:hypothetical protein